MSRMRGNIGVDFTFKSIEDFEPEQVARRVEPLRELLDLRTKLSDLMGTLQGNEKLDRLLQDVINSSGKMERCAANWNSRKPRTVRAMAKRDASEKQAAAAAPAPVTAEQTSLFDQIVTEGRVGRDETARQWGRSLVSEFVKQVLDGQMTVSPDLEAMINQRIAQIDHLLSLQLNEILHHPKFQKLESTWRGIRYLMENSETGVNLKLKVFNSTKKEILRDLQRVPEFDQSQMFKKVYEQEFGVFGGEPFACLLGDYEFGRGPEDIEFLERMSQVAAAAHAPFMAAANRRI
jgi:type VI secretion system protein ImpC